MEMESVSTQRKRIRNNSVKPKTDKKQHHDKYKLCGHIAETPNQLIEENIKKKRRKKIDNESIVRVTQG